MNDEELNKILAESRPPTPSPALDERVMKSYRKVTHRLWPAVFRARISVPVPMAVLLVAVFVVTVLWRSQQPVVPLPRIAVSMPVPIPVREIACPEPPRPATRSPRHGSATSAIHRRALTKLAWMVVLRPEWRVEQ